MATSMLVSSGSNTIASVKRPLMLRSLMLASCVAAAVAAGTYGHPEILLQTDSDLARLLRGLALIKAAILAAALALAG